MTAPIKVILATGFLGSGKTTFLNHMIATLPPGMKLAVLMNEFAEIGVDAALIEHHEEMAVIEVRKGSIFCVCAKKEFITALAKVADGISPDVLLIEATGVANPSDIRKDLALPLFHGRFEFRKQVCLVDTVHFEAAYHVYAAVEKQITTSDLFILNKVDIANRDEIDGARALILSHKPNARFIESIHAAVPVERLLQGDGQDQHPQADSQSQADSPLQADSPSQADFPPQAAPSEQLPPDQMVSAIFIWTGTQRSELESCLKELGAAVARAKGFVELEGRVHLVETVMGRIGLSPIDKPTSGIPTELRNRIVCIAGADDLERWESTAANPQLVRESTHAPVALMDMMPDRN